MQIEVGGVGEIAVGMGTAVASILAAWGLAGRKRRDVEEGEELPHLSQHQLFASLRHWRHKRDLGGACSTNPLKARCVQTFMRIKLEIFERRIHSLVERFASCPNRDEWNIEILFMEELEGCIGETNETARRAGVPGVFLGKFSEWHAPHLELAGRALHDTCTSCFYGNNKERFIAALDALLFAFRTTITDAERTLASLNGELDAALREEGSHGDA